MYNTANISAESITAERINNVFTSSQSLDQARILPIQHDEDNDTMVHITTSFYGEYTTTNSSVQAHPTCRTLVNPTYQQNIEGGTPMKHVTFAEYQEAKNEIIGGVEYEEVTQFPNQWGMSSKQYHTAENGTFYEVIDPNTGVVEFWSDKHPESRYYDARNTQAATKPLNVGKAMGEMIRQRLIANEVEYSALSDYERFLLDRGFEFHTEEALKAGYDRRWKAAHGIALTEHEFITEARGSCHNNYDTDTLQEVYANLVELVKQKKLNAGEICGYAHFKWCLHKPAAIIAYQEAQNKWHVNNCGTEVSEDEAKIAVNSEWGFEASRVRIIGTPYYDATDYQFIRFDCAHMTWLWKNGNLYQVYA